MSGAPGAIQYAALPYRRRSPVGIEVMLITSRETGRWVIPKGWPVQDKSPAGSAATEALEESGLIGRIDEQPIGSYQYDKRFTDGSARRCTVQVFPLKVERQLKSWPEKGERRTQWFTIEKAAQAVDERELAELIRYLGKSLLTGAGTD